MPTTCIVESNPGGHRLLYVRLLVDACVARGDSVCVATSEHATSSAEWRTQMAAASEPYQVERILPDRASPFHVYAEVRRLRSRFDLVVVPDGDHLVILEGLIPGRRPPGSLSVLTLRLPTRSTRAGRLKDRAISRAGARPRTHVFCLTMPGEVLSLPRGVAPVDDPRDDLADKSDDAGDSHSPLSDDVRWFGVLGAIAERKNVPAVVGALQLASHGEPQLGLCIAGKIEPDVSAWLARQDWGLLPHVVIDRYLSERELQALLPRLSCVVLAHSNDGPSGLLGYAAHARVPVLAAGAPRLTAIVEQWRLGATAESTEPAALAEGIEKILAHPAESCALQDQFRDHLRQAQNRFGQKLSLREGHGS
jgi:glycosyltransferase involved in cell wall biosynthesis